MIDGVKKYRPTGKAPVGVEIEIDSEGTRFLMPALFPGEKSVFSMQQVIELGWYEEIPEEKFCPLCHVDNGHLPECKIGKYEQIEKIVMGS